MNKPFILTILFLVLLLISAGCTGSHGERFSWRETTVPTTLTPAGEEAVLAAAPADETPVVPVCPDGFTECQGFCVDTQRDGGNCGSCGNACGADLICVEGACVE